jgi:hypothetical protein
MSEGFYVSSARLPEKYFVPGNLADSPADAARIWADRNMWRDNQLAFATCESPVDVVVVREFRCDSYVFEVWAERTITFHTKEVSECREEDR